MTNLDSLEPRGPTRRGWPTCFHRVAWPLLAWMLAIILLPGPAVAAAGRTEVVRKAPGPSLRASDLFALRERCGSADPVKESLQLIGKYAFGGPEFKTKRILAFEENRYFIYAVGVAGDADGGDGAAARPRRPPRVLRRFILLKPSTVVVDDLVRRPTSAGPTAMGGMCGCHTRPSRWLLLAPGEPKIDGRKVRIPGTPGPLVCESLLPEKVTIVSAGRAGDAQPAADDRIEVVPQGGPAPIRFLHVFRLGDPGEGTSAPRSELVEQGGRVQLTVSAEGRLVRLWFGRRRPGTDEIEITAADGGAVLARRPLPAGVLPHGPAGTRLLERWDGAYRGGRRPGWDTGRPSSELKKAVEDGTLKPCRVVELGCGLGTNAIYLAGKGFEVTAIDVAPTALARARERARKAGVNVRWLLADVLAPPPLGPFELIFDRGCYHGVRRQNAAGYVEAVRRLSRPGTRILLLAGNANEPGGGGPPRIKEEELREDFSKLFDFEWLRETRFDTRGADAKGALAWSALLRRKQNP